MTGIKTNNVQFIDAQLIEFLIKNTGYGKTERALDFLHPTPFYSLYQDIISLKMAVERMAYVLFELLQTAFQIPLF